MAVETRDYCWVIKRESLENRTPGGLPGLVWAFRDYLEVTVWFDSHLVVVHSTTLEAHEEAESVLKRMSLVRWNLEMGPGLLNWEMTLTNPLLMFPARSPWFNKHRDSERDRTPRRFQSERTDFCEVVDVNLMRSRSEGDDASDVVWDELAIALASPSWLSGRVGDDQAGSVRWLSGTDEGEVVGPHASRRRRPRDR